MRSTNWNEPNRSSRAHHQFKHFYCIKQFQITDVIINKFKYNLNKTPPQPDWIHVLLPFGKKTTEQSIFLSCRTLRNKTKTTLQECFDLCGFSGDGWQPEKEPLQNALLFSSGMSSIIGEVWREDCHRTQHHDSTTSDTDSGNEMANHLWKIKNYNQRRSSLSPLIHCPVIQMKDWMIYRGSQCHAGTFTNSFDICQNAFKCHWWRCSSIIRKILKQKWDKIQKVRRLPELCLGGFGTYDW